MNLETSLSLETSNFNEKNPFENENMTTYLESKLFSSKHYLVSNMTRWVRSLHSSFQVQRQVSKSEVMFPSLQTYSKITDGFASSIMISSSCFQVIFISKLHIQAYYFQFELINDPMVIQISRCFSNIISFEIRSPTVNDLIINLL